MANALDEYYHVASRNLAASKYNRSAHLMHYAPHVQKLVVEAPLRLSHHARRAVTVNEPPTLDMTLEDVLAQRVSSRDFGEGAVALGELWKLCYVATGIQGGGAPDSALPRRHAPNSGGLGSIEAFPIAMRVDGLPQGIYHFDSVSHEFVEIAAGDFEQWLREDVVFQEEFSRAAVAIILVGCLGRLRSKYGVRGYRLALIDAGHVSENIYLASTALGLRVCATAGFIDDEVDEALRIDGVDTASLLLVLAGRV